MKQRLLLLGLLLGLTPSLNGWAGTAAPAKDSSVAVKDTDFQWQKSCDTDGLTVYWSKVEGSNVIALKGEGIVDEPLDKVSSVIVDYTRGTEWIDSLVASKLVRNISPTEFVEYDHVGIPFPFDTLISDRDFISHVTVDYDAKTRRLTISYMPTQDELAPPLKKLTRGVMSCVFKLVPMSMEDQTYVEAEIHCDPRGSIPKWLVNFFQQGWPQTTFENLRKQVKKSDIKIVPIIAGLVQKSDTKLAQDSR